MRSAERTRVAFFRGMNGGMASLRRAFMSHGAKRVATYGQSGNVVFTGGARTIAGPLRSRFGPVFILTPARLATIVARDPFAVLRTTYRCNVMLLSRSPDAAHRRALMARAGTEYRIAVLGSVLYFAYPRALEGRRRTINFEKTLGVTGTIRSWRVVAAVVALASSLSSHTAAAISSSRSPPR